MHTLHTNDQRRILRIPFIPVQLHYCLFVQGPSCFEVSFFILCLSIPSSVKHSTLGPLGFFWGVGVEYRKLCIPWQFSRKIPMFMKRHFYTAHTNSYQCEWVHTLHTKAYDAYFAYHAYLYNPSTFCLYEAHHVYEVLFFILCIPIPTSVKHGTLGPLRGGWGENIAYFAYPCYWVV